jgi:hypothetical protein
LRALDPLAAEVSRVYGRPEDEEPTWPLEREATTGELLTSPASQTQTHLALASRAQPVGVRALARHANKPNLPYRPTADCPPLARTEVTATITTAVSPDCGFATLSGFLNATAQGLTVGMYDFTSAPILSLFKADAHDLQMVLDNPAPNDTRDQTDWQTVQDLDSSLGANAKIVRALTRSDPFVDVWSFPYAYHIKVIVRDGTAFWLSSGNLNNSNEPAPGHAKTKEDRDWHVVVEHPGLTGVFAAYLDFDYTTAQDHQNPDPDEIQRAIDDAHAKRQQQADPAGHRVHSEMGIAAAPAPAPPVGPQRFENLQLAITPLLTPDTLTPGGDDGQYLSQVLTLIQNATHSIYIQLQYIEASKGGDAYSSLLEALARRIADGLDVRLIVSADYAEKWGEKMKDGDSVDLTANIRTQPSVHNKGFVVDSKIVIVSSQNFSPAGVTQNRDAGVLMESQDIAGYFAPIFAADWDRSRDLTVRAAAAR